jgi:hypothetical protein
MKVLHLTIKKKWFDMIASGEKKEEYREIKPFWRKRLLCILQEDGKIILRPSKMFEAVKFYNGWACSDKYPNITLECEGVEIGKGKEEWGAEPEKECYIIKLGKLIK